MNITVMTQEYTKSVQQALQMVVLRNTMNQNGLAVTQLLDSLEEIPETIVNPNLGSNIDIRV